VLEYINKQSPKSKVIITSSEDEKIRQNSLQRGAFEFLEKPFELDELKGVLIKILSQAQLF